MQHLGVSIVPRAWWAAVCKYSPWGGDPWSQGWYGGPPALWVQHRLEPAFLSTPLLQRMPGAVEAASKAWSAVLQSPCCSSSGAAPSSATGSLLAKVRGRLGQPPPFQSGLKDACPEQGANDGARLQDCPERGLGTVKGCDQGLAHTQFSAAWDLARFSTDFANVSKLFILLF